MERLLPLLALVCETALPVATVLSLCLPKRLPEPPSWWKRLLLASSLYAAMTTMAWFGLLAYDQTYRVWDWRDLVFFPFGPIADFCQEGIFGVLFLAFCVLLAALPFVLAEWQPGKRIPRWLPWGLLVFFFSLPFVPFALIGWGLRKHVRRWLPWILFGVFLLHLDGCAWTVRSM